MGTTTRRITPTYAKAIYYHSCDESPIFRDPFPLRKPQVFPKEADGSQIGRINQTGDDHIVHWGSHVCVPFLAPCSCSWLLTGTLYFLSGRWPFPACTGARDPDCQIERATNGEAETAVVVVSSRPLPGHCVWGLGWICGSSGTAEDVGMRKAH